MSHENIDSTTESMDRSDAAMEAARELIAENEVLSNHPRVQALAENDFVTEDDIKLDPGNFLAAMLDFISSQETGSLSADAVTQAMDQYTVDKNLSVEVARPEAAPGEQLAA